MSFYQQHILPHVINLAMRKRELLAYRKRALAEAQGRTLEIGVGSGLNLPHYPSSVREIVGLEPSARLALKKGYMKGLKPMLFMYEGRARP